MYSPTKECSNVRQFESEGVGIELIPDVLNVRVYSRYHHGGVIEWNAHDVERCLSCMKY